MALALYNYGGRRFSRGGWWGMTDIGTRLACSCMLINQYRYRNVAGLRTLFDLLFVIRQRALHAGFAAPPPVVHTYRLSAYGLP